MNSLVKSWIFVYSFRQIPKFMNLFTQYKCMARFNAIFKFLLNDFSTERLWNSREQKNLLLCRCVFGSHKIRTSVWSYPDRTGWQDDLTVHETPGWHLILIRFMTCMLQNEWETEEWILDVTWPRCMKYGNQNDLYVWEVICSQTILSVSEGLRGKVN